MVWKGWGTPGPHSSPNFSTSQTLKIFQRIIESLRLEKTFETKSNHQHHHCAHPNSCPQVPHHQCLWAPPGMGTPMLHNLFHAEVFPISHHLNLPWGNLRPFSLILCPAPGTRDPWLSPPVRQFIFCDIFKPSHRCSPKFLAHLPVFCSQTPSLAGWKSRSAWDLSVNWHPLCEIKTINIYISFKGFSQSQGSSLDSNNFPSWDAKK